MLIIAKQMELSLIFGMIVLLMLSPALAGDTKYVPYERFIELVESGKVESVQLDNLSQVKLSKAVVLPHG